MRSEHPASPAAERRQEERWQQTSLDSAIHGVTTGRLRFKLPLGQFQTGVAGVIAVERFPIIGLAAARGFFRGEQIGNRGKPGVVAVLIDPQAFLRVRDRRAGHIDLLARGVHVVVSAAHFELDGIGGHFA